LYRLASDARHHWTIRKLVRGKRKVTTIAALADDPERLEELAAMLQCGRTRWQSPTTTTRPHDESK
jgi:DNA repair ATPase RecN